MMKNLFSYVTYVLGRTLVVGITMLVMSCDTTPPVGTDTGGSESSSMTVIALDSRTVKVRFTVRVLGVRLGYRISYRSIGESEYGVDTGSVFVGDFENRDPNPTTEITGLTPQLYEFTLSTVTTDYKTQPSYDTVRGAPAWRYNRDVQSGTSPLRLYERGSAMGDALVLDPDRLGPTVTTVDNASDGSIALALGVEADAGKSSVHVDLWVAGIVIANIPSAKADLNSILGFHDSRSQTTLDDYHVHQHRFAEMSRGVSVNYQPLQYSSDAADSTYRPMGLYARFSTETPGIFRHARILVLPSSSGKILQGVAPNRYIEFDLSIGHPGVPFA